MSVFGDHQLGIPYRPIAELFAMYRERDPSKTAIVDLDSGTAITFGQLDQVTTDVAAFLKSRGVAKGSRVLLLSDENLEKLLLWFGIWRLGAVVCPLNIEINEKVLADLAPVVNPALILYHKDIDCDALVGDCKAPRVRFGAWSADGAIDPQDECFAVMTKGHRAEELPERNAAGGHRLHLLHVGHHQPAEDRGLRPLRLLAQRPLDPRIPRADARTTARSNTARSAGTRRRC